MLSVSDEPWSSSYKTGLMSKRRGFESIYWMDIFHICCKKCNVCLKKTEQEEGLFEITELDDLYGPLFTCIFCRYAPHS